MKLDILILILLLLSTVGCIFSSRLVYAAISLAFTSVIVSILMFKLNSPLAAVFELSVCAGLITVIFISVISLVKPFMHEELTEFSKKRHKKYLALPVILIVLAVLLISVPFAFDFKLPLTLTQNDVRNVLWNERQIDLLGQIIILLSGVFGVIVFFKKGKK